MNKTDLIEALSQVLGQKMEAQKAVEKMLSSIRDSLKRGEKVILSGVGSFYPRIRKAGKRHNPKTMEPVLVPAKRTVKFIPSEELFK